MIDEDLCIGDQGQCRKDLWLDLHGNVEVLHNAVDAQRRTAGGP